MRLKQNIYRFIGTIVILALGVTFYAFKVEVNKLKIREFVLNEPAGRREEVKIVQFSDTHFKADFTVEKATKIVDAINAQSPDFVIFTGDLYDNYEKYHADEALIAEFSRIEASYDKIAIWGNRDNGGGAMQVYADMMKMSGFTLLENMHELFTLENRHTLVFTGLDDAMLGVPEMPAFDFSKTPDYSVLLAHQPDMIYRFETDSYDLILSGHSHGGQINVPWIPSINTAAVQVTNYSTIYSGGMYDLPLDAKVQKMYVNRGIGTTHISARLGVPPELAVFTIYI